MTPDSRLCDCAGFLIIALLLCARCTRSPPAPAMTTVPVTITVVTETTRPVATATASQTATKEEVVSFVREAVAYAHRNGKEMAIAEFSDRNGSFFRGVLYIHVYGLTALP